MSTASVSHKDYYKKNNILKKIQVNANSVKIAVLGKGVVGKSSLTYRFINFNAPTEHDPTIEDRYKSSLKYENQDYEIEILDTAGEEDYQNMMDMWISFGEGFLLVFAINDEESFELLKGKRERILKGKHQVKCPILLVGNKKDLENERKVSYEQAKALADKWEVTYMETSAKENENCKEAFEALAQQIIKQKQGAENKSKTCCNII